MKQEILDRINEVILDENGKAVTIDNTFLESELDSLGVMLTLITLDDDYHFLLDVPEDADIVEYLGVLTLTIKDLVNLCRLSIINFSKVQKLETPT